MGGNNSDINSAYAHLKYLKNYSAIRMKKGGALNRWKESFLSFHLRLQLPSGKEPVLHTGQHIKFFAHKATSDNTSKHEHKNISIHILVNPIFSLPSTRFSSLQQLEQA